MQENKENNFLSYLIKETKRDETKALFGRHLAELFVLLIWLMCYSLILYNVGFSWRIAVKLSLILSVLTDFLFIIAMFLEDIKERIEENNELLKRNFDKTKY